MYIVSACLAGIRCRYDGTSSPDSRIVALVESGEAITICPEQLGGLPTPRPRCEISESDGLKRVVSIDGDDFTEEFLSGAERSLELALKNKIDTAILKSGSPSCGCEDIYDGTFSGKKRKGNGVTAGLFLEKGIKVYTELNFLKI